MTPDKKMKGSRALVRRARARGLRRHLRVSRRRRDPVLRRALRRQEAPPRARAPRAGRGARRRRLRPRHRQGRRLHGHQRPRRHQPGHRHRHRLPGLDRRWWPSPGRCAATSSAPTPSRRPTSPASRCRSSSTPTWSRDAAELPRIVHEAFHIASTGRPGPVVIDIPVDVALGELAYREADDDRPARLQADRSRATSSRSARPPRPSTRPQRPVLYLGGGVIASDAGPGDPARWPSCAGCRSPPRSWASAPSPRRTSSPWACSACTAPSPPTTPCTSATCSSPSARASTTASPASSRPSRRTPRSSTSTSTRPRSARTSRRSSRSSATPSTWPPGWSRSSRAWSGRPSARPSGWRASPTRKDEFPLHYEDPEDGKLAPQFVIQEIDRVTGARRRSSAPTWASTRCGRRSTTRTRTRASSSAPAAWAPWASGCRRASAPRSACPDKTVIDISGDGGFQMTMQELATAVSYDVPVVVCILNNGYLGMVRQWQDLFWNKRYSFTCIDVQPDFKLLAEAFGAVGMTRHRRRTRSSRRCARRSAAAGRWSSTSGSRAEENVFPDGPGRPGDHRDDRRPRARRGKKP